MNADQRESRHRDYLGHMLEALRLARSHTATQTEEDFLGDRKTQQAVILNILIIGEAATKLANEYPEFVTQHPAFPWKQRLGMRNHRRRLEVGNEQHSSLTSKKNRSNPRLIPEQTLTNMPIKCLYSFMPSAIDCSSLRTAGLP